MKIAFWLFSLTCVALALTVAGLQLNTISEAAGSVIRQLMGPVLAINIGLLFYLADRDWSAAKQQNSDLKTR